MQSERPVKTAQPINKRTPILSAFHIFFSTLEYRSDSEISRD
jgi:hypothetical protein